MRYVVTSPVRLTLPSYKALNGFPYASPIGTTSSLQCEVTDWSRPSEFVERLDLCAYLMSSVSDADVLAGYR